LLLCEGDYFQKEEHAHQTIDSLAASCKPSDASIIKKDLDRTINYRRKEIQDRQQPVSEERISLLSSSTELMLRAFAGLTGEYIQGFGSIAFAVSFVVHSSMWLLEGNQELRMRLPVDSVHSVESAFSIFYGIMMVAPHQQEFAQDFALINKRCSSMYASLKWGFPDLFARLFPDDVD
jgi:hypothetical protein